MKGYTTRDVENLLGLSRRHARELGRSGVLDAGRGPGNRYLFTFQDLVLLRTAKELLDAHVPHRRVVRALRRLKGQLPADRSLTELQIAAVGEEVVVRDEETAWEPESGQLHFTFDVSDLAVQVERLTPRSSPSPADAGAVADWLEEGEALEAEAPDEARSAYRKALDVDPTNAAALVNLGRLLHTDGQLEAAVVHYRRALEASGGDDATAAFNLGLALEDLGRRRAAMDAYTAALAIDPGFADAHYNLSRIHERLGDRVSALRHLKSYRALTRGP